MSVLARSMLNGVEIPEGKKSIQDCSRLMLADKLTRVSPAENE